MCSNLDCIPWHTPEEALLWPPFLESTESFPVHVYRKIDGWYREDIDGDPDDDGVVGDDSGFPLESDLASEDNK